MANDETIVAIATAPGEAAIAVTRLSGPDALPLAARHFRGTRSPLDTPSHRVLFGAFLDASGAPLDTILLSVFRAPHSYTGEDAVEISSHGGAAIPRAVLETLVRAGARPARPGEFTERAYRNGKIDLAQAEAVASVVRARSDRAARAARATLGGALSRRIEAADAALVWLLAEVESRIDFPGDVRETADVRALAERCGSLAASIRDWLARLPSARRRDEGISVAILGAPNVGKSSLLNALAGFDRAIVSETPGTTRDTIEASIWLDGIEIRLVDTAGMRVVEDPLERLGLERTERAAAAADLAIVVRDCTRPGAGLGIEASLPPSTPRLVAWNKADLAPRGAARSAPPRREEGGVIAASSRPPLVEVETVAVRPGGVSALVEAMRAALPSIVGATASDEVPATSARQEALLHEALEGLERAEIQLLAGQFVGTKTDVAIHTVAAAEGPLAPDPDSVAYDLAAVDLTEARRALGEIVGRGVDDAVIAAIFQRFCIGK